METIAEVTKGCEWCTNWLRTGFKDGKATVRTKLQELDEWTKHYEKAHRSKHHKGNGTYNGAFAFTLTMSPADELTAGDLLVAVRKVMSQKSNKVVRYAWYYEDKGKDAEGVAIHPHIHGMYETETGGRIHSKHWQRAWKIWDERKPMGQGFRGGYHRPVKMEECYDVYIKKSNMLGEKMLPMSITNAEVSCEQSETTHGDCRSQSDKSSADGAEGEEGIRKASASNCEEEAGNKIC